MPKRMKLNFKGGAETPTSTSTSDDSDNSIVIVIVLAIIACIFFLVVGGVVYYFFIKDDDDETPASSTPSPSTPSPSTPSPSTPSQSTPPPPPPEPTCKDTGTCCSCNKNCALKDNPEDRVTDDQCGIHPDAEYDGEKPSDVQEFCYMCYDIIDTGCRLQTNCPSEGCIHDPVIKADGWCDMYDGEVVRGHRLERCSPNSNATVNKESGLQGLKLKDAYPIVLVNDVINNAQFPHVRDQEKGQCEKNQGQYIFWTHMDVPN